VRLKEIFEQTRVDDSQITSTTRLVIMLLLLLLMFMLMRRTWKPQVVRVECAEFPDTRKPTLMQGEVQDDKAEGTVVKDNAREKPERVARCEDEYQQQSETDKFRHSLLPAGHEC
jgi:hypothetical protein